MAFPACLCFLYTKTETSCKICGLIQKLWDAGVKLPWIQHLVQHMQWGPVCWPRLPGKRLARMGPGQAGSQWPTGINISTNVQRCKQQVVILFWRIIKNFEWSEALVCRVSLLWLMSCVQGHSDSFESSMGRSLWPWQWCRPSGLWLRDSERPCRPSQSSY